MGDYDGRSRSDRRGNGDYRGGRGDLGGRQDYGGGRGDRGPDRRYEAGRGGYDGGRGGYDGGRGGYDGGRGGYGDRGDRGGYGDRGDRSGYGDRGGGYGDRGGGYGDRGGRGGFDRGDRGRGGYGDRGGRGGRGGYGEGGFGGGRGDRGGRGGGRGGGGRGAAPIALKSGRFMVLTNIFPIRKPTVPKKVNKYLVEIVSCGDSTRAARNEDKVIILEKFLRSEGINDILPYDRDRALYSLMRFKSMNGTVEFNRDKFDISISFQSEHDLCGEHRDVRASDETASIIDVILHHAAQISQRREGRVKFVPLNPTPDQLHALRGFPGKDLCMGHSQTVQASRKVELVEEYGVVWNGENPYQKALSYDVGAVISPAAVVTIRRMPLIDYCRECFDLSLVTASPEDPRARRACRSLKGLQISTNHVRNRDDPSQRRKICYKIRALVFDMAPKTLQIDGKSMVQFFRETHGINLQFPEGPVVEVTKKNKTYLPVELVHVEQQKLPSMYDDALKSAVADSMCFDPADRKRYIQEKVEEVFGHSEVLMEYGLAVDNTMAQWRAELIEPPMLRYRNPRDGSPVTLQPEKGAWNMRDKAFIDPRKLERVWLLDTAGITQSRNGEATGPFFAELRSQLRNVGMTGAVNLRTQFLRLDQLENFGKTILSVQANKPDMTVVLLEKKATEPYKIVKSALDRIGPSQCLVVSNTPGMAPSKPINRGAGHICNILSKVNQKLVGINHSLDSGAKTALKHMMGGEPMKLMVVGVNMSNPAGPNVGAARNAPSVSSLVLSILPDCTKWAHSFRIQKRGNERVEELSAMLRDALEIRTKTLKCEVWPASIVYIRDGVSEGQMEHVIDDEFQAIRTCYTDSGREPPSVTIVVAVRTHAIRFWDPDTHDSRANLPPGTFVCMDGVHNAKFPNFYLLSHAGIKGTSRPVRYFLMRDDLGPKLGLKGKILKYWATFLYEQCYMYQRCQRAVRVPAPIYYADQLAQRGRIISAKYVESELGVSLFSDTMSMSSGGRGGLNLSEEERAQGVFKINELLQQFTNQVPPMFYC